MKTNASFGRRIGLAALGLSILIPVLPAAAFDRASDTGQRALINMLVRKVGRGTTAVFQSTESRNTGNDTVISGRGYTKPGRGALGRGNDRSRDFTYSVRVERGGNTARDLMIRFSNNETLRDSGPFGRDDDDNGGSTSGRRPTVTKPEQNFTDADGDVTFEGRSDARNVTLNITSRYGDRGNTTRRLTVRDGKWSTNLRLQSGTYSVRVSNDGRAAFDQSETVNFNVGSGSSSIARATFDRPENNFRDSDGEIRFSGRSGGRQVELKIYRGNRQVSSRKVDVRNEQWDVTLKLGEGDYRATVEAVNGRGTSTVRFSVDRR